MPDNARLNEAALFCCHRTRRILIAKDLHRIPTLQLHGGRSGTQPDKIKNEYPNAHTMSVAYGPGPTLVVLCNNHAVSSIQYLLPACSEEFDMRLRHTWESAAQAYILNGREKTERMEIQCVQGKPHTTSVLE